MDSLFFNDKKRGLENIFHSSDIAEVEFNDETQLLYITPINVADRTSIFIAGIIKKSHYNHQAFQIGFFTIIDKEFTSKTKAKRLIFRTIWQNPTKTSRYLFLNIYVVVSLLIYVIGDMYNNVILTYSFFSALIFALGLFYFIYYYSKTIFLLGMIPSEKKNLIKKIQK